MADNVEGLSITLNADKFKWTAGGSYECTMSASPAYKVGDVVQCYTNEKGWKCIKGRDGLEDICSMLVSSFRVKEV